MNQTRRLLSLPVFAAIMAALISSACDKSSAAKPDGQTQTPIPASLESRGAVPEPPTSNAVAVKTPNNPAPLSTDMTPKEMYIAYCGACHSVDLVESQRLGREDWAWVMQDMVEEYGGAWIKPDEQRIIIDYLAENFGPN